MGRLLRGSRLFGESLWLALAQGGGIVARLAGVKALTTILTPSAYGEATLLLGIAAFGTNVFCLPVLQASLRFYPDAISAGRLPAFRALIGRSLAVALVALLAALGIGAVIYDATGPGHLSGAAIACLAALLVADTARMFESGLLNAARRQRAFSLWTLLDAIARPACAVAAALVFAATGTGVIAGNVAGCLLASLPFLPLLETSRKHPGSGEGNDEAWRSETRAALRRFVGPLVPFALLGWVIGIGDRYVIAALAGTAAAGLYGAAYGLASQPFLALSALGVAAVRPILFAAAANGDGRTVARTVRRFALVVAALGATGVIIVALLSRPIMRLLTGPAFVEASPLLVWIAAGYALQCLQYVFETILYARRATGRLMVIQAIGAATAVALYATLIPKYGAMGAAWATFGSFVASSLTSVVLSGGLPVLRGGDARISPR